MSNPDKAPQAPAELSEYGDFPPPPPGPPPPQHGQHHPQQPLHAEQQPLHAEQQPLHAEQHHGQKQQQDYAIPSYNPADPVFAAPPTAEATSSQPAAAHPAAPIQTPIQPEGDAHAHKKSGWGDRFSQLGAKVAAPINSLAHKVGSQSFLPEALDKECDKAAVILKAFCKKGVYADPTAGQPPTSTSTDPKAAAYGDGIIDPTKEKPSGKVMVTIPPKVISKALGLAIFTTLRAGFQFSGATGSGVLIARLPDGSWGPPSGIQVHSVGGGFMIGLDIYDCVCVINSKDALDAFMNTRVSLGSDLAVVAGPYGAGGGVDMGASVDRNREAKGGADAAHVKHVDEVAAAPVDPAVPASQQTLQPDSADKKSSRRRSLSPSGFKPVFSYVKSRGFYAGIQVDGTVVVERKDANNAFYGSAIPVDQILKGNVPAQGPAGMWPMGAHILHEVLKGAEAGAIGDKDISGTATHPSAPLSGSPAVESTGAMHSDAPPPQYSDPEGKGAAFEGDVKYS